MATKGFRERILEIETAGSALASSTTETSLMPSSQLTAFTPAGYFDSKGKRICFCFSGQMSNIVTTPGTLTLKLYLDSVAVFSSGALPLNTTAKTNVGWYIEGELVCQAFGASTATTLFPKMCRFQSESYIGSAAATAGGNGIINLPYNTAPAAGTGFDNGPSHLIDFKATWSVNNAGNSIQLMAGHVDLYT
jgi:hypothetical protein